MTAYASLFLGGSLLALYQFLAALPWLWALDPEGFRQQIRRPSTWVSALGGIIGAGILIGFWMDYRGDTSVLRWDGRLYGFILSVQLIFDFLILVPRLLLQVWPKGGAVALAAFREGWRQPMFWLIIVLMSFLIGVSIFLPYFTFGEEYKMMKQLGFDMIMLSSAVFGVLAASISINEDIEGRTAITLISKPVTRRQFLIGKFLGITFAALAMTLVLGIVFNWALYIKPTFDVLEDPIDPMPREAVATLVPILQAMVPSPEGAALASGIATWLGETLANTLGFLLGFGQVIVLVALASALATRVPFVVNLVLCLMVFFLGHLSPVLVQVTSNLTSGGDAPSQLQLVGFLAQLFDAVLPALEFFNMGPAIVRDSPIELGAFSAYVGTVFVYSLIYAAIALLLGLILFEDRDLA